MKKRILCNDNNKTCTDCIWLDECFGDCCHTLSGGCLDLTWALNECLRKDYKYKEIRDENEK